MYADQVQNIRDKLAQLQEEKIENYNDLANSITEEYNDKMKEYGDKWKAVQEAGGEEVAGLLGAKSIYAGGKKLVDLYKKRKERTKAQREKEQSDEVDPDDFDEDAEPLDGAVRSAVSGSDDSPVDFYNEDGEKYFTGTEADHEQYYNDDGTLKDPSQIPEGHQSTETQQEDDGVPDEPAPPPAEEPDVGSAPDAPDVPDLDTPADVPAGRPLAPQDIDVSDVIGGQRTKARVQLERFNAQQDAQKADEASGADDPDAGSVPDAPDAQPVPQQSFEDVVRQGQAQRQQRLQQGDDVADQNTTMETGEAPPVEASPRGVPEINVDAPLQPTAGQRVRPTEFGGEEPPAPDIIGGGQEGLTGAETGSSLLERAGQKAFTSLASRGKSIREGFNAVKNFFSPSGGATAETATEATTGAVEGATEAGLGTADAVLGAIPVVGELALAVSGFVAIGEGIYHLFHPDKKPPAPKASAPLTAPHALTAKYAMALPSVDNAVDRSATSTAF